MAKQTVCTKWNRKKKWWSI